MSAGRLDELRVLRAAWVAPMDGAVIADGAVAHRAGTIVALGRWPDVRREHASAMVDDAGDAVILPGLVNAHVHLELSGCACGDSPPSFVDWILSIPGRIRAVDKGPDEEILPPATRWGAEQCLRFGVTTVGDISQQPHITRPVLRGGPLRVVSFGEAIGIGANRPRYDERLARAIDRRWESPHLRTALSPHAPYSVDLPGFRQCLALSRGMGLPVATHLAETPHEREFLEHHAGPFRRLLETFGIWRDDIETMPAGPIAFAREVGLLDRPALLAHVNYCDDEDLETLARGRASVVYCPRTHAYFRHTLHRWREMLARDINVAVGTDSTASSPDLNLVDDLRLLHRVAPEVEPIELWRMATTRAAHAVRLQDAVGRLSPGYAADFTVFAARSNDPLRDVLETPDALPLQVWINGTRR